MSIPKGTQAEIGNEIETENGTGVAGKALPSDEGNGDGDLTFLLSGDLEESTLGEINRVGIGAGRASILDVDDDRLAVLVVGDLELVAAKSRDLAEVTVAAEVDRSNQGVVVVEVAAGTGDTTLEVEGSETAAVGAGSLLGEGNVRGGGGLLGGAGGGLGSLGGRDLGRGC